MVPLRVSITKVEWLPDDPTAFVPSMLWKLLFITTWDDSQNRSHPTDSAEEALLLLFLGRVLFPDTGSPQGLHSSCSACQSPALPYRSPLVRAGCSGLLCSA